MIHAKCVPRTSYKNICVDNFKNIRKDVYDIRNIIWSEVITKNYTSTLLHTLHRGTISSQHGFEQIIT